ncbi:ATP synthase subunit b' isoform 2 [Theobroma cacao]|uniref:ATP synthase subunit b' isoform 2 n=1 Tax=Theobroma cacao TaxID=3641 RepID=A0A061GIT7_THECC|nr:ATP synthase subunit b' isoform 2 [Theobroma cacao]
MLRIEVEEFSTPRASLEKPRRSISSSLPSLVIVNGFSRKSFSYSKLPEEPIKLSVLKLDGSSFDVEVIKSATIAELKLAVQDVFSHMPTKGPGKISWPHVWGHFALCYEGWKLVTDTDSIINYGIRDGDQLRFIRHISPIYNMTKIQSKRRIVARKQSYLSISSSASSLGSEQNDEEDDEYDDMENGRYQTHKDESPSIVVEQECRFGHLWRGWSSYSRMSTIRKTGSRKGVVFQSRYGSSFLGNFRKILRLWGSTNYYRKHTWKED